MRTLALVLMLLLVSCGPMPLVMQDSYQTSQGRIYAGMTAGRLQEMMGEPDEVMTGRYNIGWIYYEQGKAIIVSLRGQTVTQIDIAPDMRRR